MLASGYHFRNVDHDGACLETGLIIGCVAKPLLAPPFLRESKLPRDLVSTSPPARK